MLSASSAAGGKPLVTHEVLRRLGPDGVLVNVGRGALVDEQALIEALRDGTVQGAALDVFADEPRVPEALRSSDRVVLAPHRASATVETRSAMAVEAAQALLDHFAGRTPAHLVT